MLRLISYRPLHVTETEELAVMEISAEIAPALSTLHLGFCRHIFEIEVDGALYRVQIDGKEAKVLKIPVVDGNREPGHPVG